MSLIPAPSIANRIMFHVSRFRLMRNSTNSPLYALLGTALALFLLVVLLLYAFQWHNLPGIFG